MKYLTSICEEFWKSLPDVKTFGQEARHLHVLHLLWKHWFQVLQKDLDLIYLTNMNRLISILCCCLLKKTLVITTNLTNPESVSGIICLTKTTYIAIKLQVELLLRVQKKNWGKWNMLTCGVVSLDVSSCLHPALDSVLV